MIGDGPIVCYSIARSKRRLVVFFSSSLAVIGFEYGDK